MKRLGLGVATPGAVERGQVVRGPPYIGMVGADILFGDLQGLQQNHHCPVLLTGLADLQHLLVDNVPLITRAPRGEDHFHITHNNKSEDGNYYVFHSIFCDRANEKLCRGSAFFPIRFSTGLG